MFIVNFENLLLNDSIKSEKFIFMKIELQISSLIETSH